MNQKRGILLILAAAVISGFSIFINKFSVAQIESSVFTFLKNAMTAMLLAGIILLTGEFSSIRKLAGKQWLMLLLIGLIGGSIPFILFFKGLSLSSAAMGAFIHKTLFIYASIFALIFLRERISKKVLIGGILLMIGSLLLIKLKTPVFSKGEMLILAAALLWAAENVLSKYALKELSGNVVAFGRMLFGSFFILGYLFIAANAQLIPKLTIDSYLWTLMTSILLLGYVMAYYNGLKAVKVSTATAILLLGSPITSILSSIYSKTFPPLMEISGIALISAGALSVIYFAEFPKKSFPQHTHNVS